MEYKRPKIDEIVQAMKYFSNIRNVCILANINHGKTTLCNCLMETNNILNIYPQEVGSVPKEDLLENNKKSSGISLFNMVNDDYFGVRPLLLHIIETTGHMDYYKTITYALRACDGAILIVDLEDGVCFQTRECIRKAIQEKLPMILILNKFDRLIVDRRMGTYQVLDKILRILDSCNEVIIEEHQKESVKDEIDDEKLFNPVKGNVIFASAIHEWGFTLRHIATVFLDEVADESVDSLTEKMWDLDLYIDANKTINFGAIKLGKENLFQTLCIETLIKIYEVVYINMDRSRLTYALGQLKIKNSTREMFDINPQAQIKAIMSYWWPLSGTVFAQCLKIFDPPTGISTQKMNYLMDASRFKGDTYAIRCIKQIAPYLLRSVDQGPAPTVAFISDMFYTTKHDIKPNLFWKEEEDLDVCAASLETQIEAMNSAKRAKEVARPSLIDSDLFEVIGLGRVYTGELRVGQEIYVLYPKYKPLNVDPEKVDRFVYKNKFVERIKIKSLYIFTGREFSLVEKVPMGNICGIGGLGMSVIRSATLSTTLAMAPFSDHESIGEPVIKKCIQSALPREKIAVQDSLQIMQLQDVNVHVLISENEEFVLLTPGDEYLLKCINEIIKKPGKLAINVSPLRLYVRDHMLAYVTDYEYISNLDNYVWLHSYLFTMAVVAIELPDNLLSVLNESYPFMRDIEDHKKKNLETVVRLFTLPRENDGPDVFMQTRRNSIKRFIDTVINAREFNGLAWHNFEHKIWSVWRNRDSMNVLVNNTPGLDRNIFVELHSEDRRVFYDHCITNAFEGLCNTGLDYNRKMKNVAFFISIFNPIEKLTHIEMTKELEAKTKQMVIETFRLTVDKRDKRIMEHMFPVDPEPMNTTMLENLFLDDVSTLKYSAAASTSQTIEDGKQFESSDTTDVIASLDESTPQYSSFFRDIPQDLDTSYSLDLSNVSASIAADLSGALNAYLSTVLQPYELFDNDNTDTNSTISLHVPLEQDAFLSELGNSEEPFSSQASTVVLDPDDMDALYDSSDIHNIPENPNESEPSGSPDVQP